MEVNTRSMIIVFVPLLFCVLVLETSQPPTATAMSTQHGNNATDWSSLLAFRSLISDDPLRSLASWNDSLHFCRWRGVTCGRRHPGRVTALELDSLRLVGLLSPFLANLTFLRRISLSNNRFEGRIPKDFGRLRQLRYLNLTHNSLDGVIPSALGRCSLLRVLSLRDNALQGSFGSVYKGIIMDHGNERTVAVKVLNLQRYGASRSFMAECKALRNIRHRNLVKIFTLCSSIDHHGNDFKALVFEFMPNGSLEEWLHRNAREDHQSRSLSLVQRLNIAIDIASALEYLHHLGTTPIVHCDLKPSNVLLDKDLTAHVGDFGLASFLVAHGESSQSSSSTVGIRGTVGYVPPEYGMGNQASTAGDVYSYGILLLEIFTGKKPIDDKFKDGLNLHKYVQMAFSEQVMDIIDHRLFSTEEHKECIAAVIKYGLLCSKESPEERLEMTEVAKEMVALRDKFLKGLNP